jgi:hypothetical protein
LTYRGNSCQARPLGKREGEYRCDRRYFSAEVGVCLLDVDGGGDVRAPSLQVAAQVVLKAKLEIASSYVRSQVQALKPGAVKPGSTKGQPASLYLEVAGEHGARGGVGGHHEDWAHVGGDLAHLIVVAHVEIESKS